MQLGLGDPSALTAQSSGITKVAVTALFPCPCGGRLGVCLPEGCFCCDFHWDPGSYPTLCIKTEAQVTPEVRFSSEWLLLLYFASLPLKGEARLKVSFLVSKRCHLGPKFPLSICFCLNLEQNQNYSVLIIFKAEWVRRFCPGFASVLMNVFHLHTQGG